jgi:hypothetical protein
MGHKLGGTRRVMCTIHIEFLPKPRETSDFRAGFCPKIAQMIYRVLGFLPQDCLKPKPD